MSNVHCTICPAVPQTVAAALVGYPVSFVHFAVAPPPHSSPLTMPRFSNNTALIHSRPVAINNASAAASPRVALPQPAHHAAISQRQLARALPLTFRPVPLPHTASFVSISNTRKTSMPTHLTLPPHTIVHTAAGQTEDSVAVEHIGLPLSVVRAAITEYLTAFALTATLDKKTTEKSRHCVCVDCMGRCRCGRRDVREVEVSEGERRW